MNYNNEHNFNSQIQLQIQSWYTQWLLVDRLYASFAQQYGITSTAMFVLRMLLVMPESCTQRSICESLTLPKQTVSCLLESLEKTGYVEKKPDQLDKRSKLIGLTSKGRDYTKRVLAALNKAEAAAFLTLSENDRLEFTRINEALTKALHNQLQVDDITAEQPEGLEQEYPLSAGEIKSGGLNQ